MTLLAAAPTAGSGTDYPRYETSEYERRWAAVRDMMAAADAQVLVVAGHAAARHELQHLCNAPVRWESFLVVPIAADPVLLVPLDNHAAGLEPWSVVPVEVAAPDPAGVIAARVGDARTVAMLGPWSERAATRLRQLLPERTFVDLSGAFLQHRLRKASAEIAWTREAAALCDAAVEGFLTGARAGMREDELGAVLESAVLHAGGQVGICFLATSSAEVGGAAVPRQAWSRRPTQTGDIAMFELSAGLGGATGQVLRTVVLGGEPVPIVRRLHEVADEAYEALLEAVRPGAPAAALEAIGGRLIDAAGLTIIDDLVHGYGGGYLPPHVRTPATRRAPVPALTLEAGMLLVLQPNIVTLDHRHGVQTGDLVLVTESGCQQLHRAPRGLLRTGG